MGKETRHITAAVQSLAKAQAAMSERIDRHEKIIDSQAREITELQAQVLNIRNAAIKTDLEAGMSGQDVALKYDLSPGRISQIRNA
jgi:DNA-binding NarL/FixJ family response regulator